MDIVKTILDATTQFLVGIGRGIVDVFEKLIFEHTYAAGEDGILGTIDDVVTNTKTLSSFAIWSLTFLGISLAIGLFYKLFNKVG